MKTSTEPLTNIEELLDQNLVCEVGDCKANAVAITSHGVSVSESKCHCLVCRKHYESDRMNVLVAKRFHINGDCHKCGEKGIPPENVYFREL